MDWYSKKCKKIFETSALLSLVEEIQRVTKKFPAIVPFIAENIYEENPNAKRFLKGDVLAKIKVNFYGSTKKLCKLEISSIYILKFIQSTEWSWHRDLLKNLENA